MFSLLNNFCVVINDDCSESPVVSEVLHVVQLDLTTRHSQMMERSCNISFNKIVFLYNSSKPAPSCWLRRDLKLTAKCTAKYIVIIIKDCFNALNHIQIPYNILIQYLLLLGWRITDVFAFIFS